VHGRQSEMDAHDALGSIRPMWGSENVAQAFAAFCLLRADWAESFSHCGPFLFKSFSFKNFEFWAGQLSVWAELVLEFGLLFQLRILLSLILFSDF
jgi:hypothetical protein